MVIAIRRLQALTRQIPRSVAWIASAALALPCFAQMGGDLQAQILYAYETEDLNQLTDLVQSLSTDVKANGGDMALRYHLAHADYRLAELLGEAHRRQAESALADCSEQLSKLLDHDSRSVEALVLSSACLEGLAKYRKVEGVILRTKAGDRLSTASKLAARNPRVLLLRATNDLQRARPGSPESTQAFAELQQAAQRFDETSATNPDAPGWGHADAYLALGRQYLQRGDLLAARNWIEKSLIAAPDFKAAQRQLAALAQH
jgi:tetratricopeptide (TPR) repeat protein